MADPRQEQSRRAPESDADRRKHQRIETPLKARFLNDAGVEQPCLVMNASAGGALIKAKVPPPADAHIVIYIDQVGRFEARVIRSSSNIFAVNYEKKRRKNARTADALTEVVNNDRRDKDRRGGPRIRQDAPATVRFEDGREEHCAILDISLTGASIEISPRPPLGARLILGRMHAKVVRRHEKGVGVVFTGAAEKMTDVIEETAAPIPTVDDGLQVAKPFGKKTR